jgi:hypothetical protein
VNQDSYPEDGWWWDKDASGRGYFIERQQDYMFIAAFIYTPSGDPEWLTSQGFYTPDNGDGNIGNFSGEVYKSAGGQCPGCAYTAPATEESSQGPLTVSFSDNQTGTLEWSGESIPISRFLWSWGDAVEQLNGLWLITHVEIGEQLSQLVTITDSGDDIAQIDNAVSGASVGSVELLAGDLVLTLDSASETELPLVIPESKRFYAGYSSSDALQVVAVRLDDMPIVINSETGGEFVAAVDQFTSNVILSSDGTTLTIQTDDLPNHTSPYWGQGHDLYEEPHNGMVVNPNTIAEQDITFRIPANPQIAATPTDTGLGAIGVAVNGVVFFNQYAGIDRTTGEFLPLDNEIASFDSKNGHPQMTGQYHYHFEPLHLTVADNSAFLGFAMDGFPIYGPRNADGSDLALDECNGESHITSEYPDGTYHYHITQVAPYILGCFRGTPGTATQ